MDDLVSMFLDAFEDFFGVPHPGIIPDEADRLNDVLWWIKETDDDFFYYCVGLFFRSPRGGDHHIWAFCSPGWQEILQYRAKEWPEIMTRE